MDRLPPMDSPKLSESSEIVSRRIAAKEGARRLLGCYRTGDANDPESYITAVVSVLTRYSVEIIREVTEPATGIPSRLKWLPTIAEIREECEILAQRARRKVEREQQIREQLEYRDQFLIPDMRPRKTYQQIVDECRAVGIMIGPKGKTAVDIGQVLKTWGISQEQWNAIPDAK